MAAITHLMGRVTKDPVVQQAKNTGTEYISLDLAVSQRSQNNQNGQNPYETVYYQCFFNQYLAERLQKANVKKGTCLYLYGELELHPFIYQQGQKAGQAGINARINVRDWQFCLSNKPENESGAAAPGNNGYPNQGTPNANSGYTGVPSGGTVPNGAYASPQPSQAGAYAGGYAAQQAGAAAPNYGNMPTAPYSGGFSAVPEGQAPQLPFH